MLINNEIRVLAKHIRQKNLYNILVLQDPSNIFKAWFILACIKTSEKV